MAKTANAATKSGLTWKHKIGYAMGDMGGCMTFALMGAYVTRYYVNVLKVNTNGTETSITINNVANATSATKATQDGNGATIATTYAKLAGPTFTGTPKAPTAAAGTNTTQIATTAFVTNAVATLAKRVSALEADFSNFMTKTEYQNEVDTAYAAIS